MGGRHPKFWAEVEMPHGRVEQIEEVARKHGLVVLVGPDRIGLSAHEQVTALRRAFPDLKIEEKPEPKGPELKSHNPGFEKLCQEVRTRIREISPSEAHRRVTGGKARFFDIREDHEWTDGHPAGAAHLGRGILERDIEKVVTNLDEEVILLCGGGYRSALAADNLQRMGYRNVASVAGGLKGWKQAGLPEER